ncbi:formate--tetrahydrofolate ligase, partial [Klebsiella pneumoniae]
GKELELFRKICKHSTLQCKKITNIAWQKHQTIN